MYKIEFIDSKTLVNKILEDLDSYNNAGFIDSGRMYKWINQEINYLNLPGYSPMKSIVRLEDSIWRKPNGFRNLWAMWKINPCGIVSEAEEFPKQVNAYSLYTEATCYDVDECTGDIEEKGQHMMVRQYERGVETYMEFCSREPLSIKTAPDVPCTFKDSFRYYSSMFQVYEKKTHFEFNFKDEHIYVEYFGHLIDNKGLPLVPNEEVLERAIDSFLKFKFFEYLWTNQLGDYLQRMQHYQLEYRLAHDLAVDWLKTPTFLDTIEFMRKRKDRYNKFDNKRMNW